MGSVIVSGARTLHRLILFAIKVGIQLREHFSSQDCHFRIHVGAVLRPALPVGPSGRSGVAGATSAEATLLSVNFAGQMMGRGGQRYGSR